MMVGSWPVLMMLAAQMTEDCMEFTTVVKGTTSNIEGELSTLIRETAAWETFWMKHKPDDDDRPDVDFGQEMVVCVFLGTRPTGGHSVQITRVEAKKGSSSLDVHYESSTPSPEQMVSQALTQPHHCVRTLRSDRSLKLLHTEAAPPLPPIKYITILHDDAELQAVESRLSALPGVLEVALLKSIKMAVVTFDGKDVDTQAMEASLAAVDGVKIVERDN
jgi:hypothetical protein